MAFLDWFRPAEPPAAAAAPPWAGADLEQLRDVLRRASMGDLDVRVSGIEPSSPLAGMGDDINHLLDLVDAFMRETEGCLGSAQAGRHHRRFLLRGMLGGFAAGARQMNSVSAALADHRAGEAPRRAGREEPVPDAF